MKDELGLGVVVIEDYGFSRVHNAAEYDRLYSLHRRMLRKRFWKMVAVTLAVIVIIGIIIAVSTAAKVPHAISFHGYLPIISSIETHNIFLPMVSR